MRHTAPSTPGCQAGISHEKAARVPQTGLCSAAGRIARVLLGDYGVAKQVGGHQSTAAMTQVGTPLYMSPEALSGRSYGVATDIWSVGCVLVELMANTYAFSAASKPQLVANVLAGRFAHLPSKYSPALRSLVPLLLQQVRAALPSPPPSSRRMRRAAPLAMRRPRMLSVPQLPCLRQSSDRPGSHSKVAQLAACALIARLSRALSQDPHKRPSARELLLHPALVESTAEALIRSVELGKNTTAGQAIPADLSCTMADFHSRVVGEPIYASLMHALRCCDHLRILHAMTASFLPRPFEPRDAWLALQLA